MAVYFVSLTTDCEKSQSLIKMTLNKSVGIPTVGVVRSSETVRSAETVRIHLFSVSYHRWRTPL